MKNKLSITIGFMIGLLVFSGCDKNFEDINIDPTKLSPANMNYNYLFTSAQLVTSGNSDGNAYEDWRNNLIYASCMIQHLSSTTGYWAGDKYTYNSGYNSAYWDANYPNSIKNIVDVIENIKSDPDKKNFYQIARIFKVYMMQRMTDMYGDIPYFEAGKGYTEGVTQPKYDTQEAIYDDMLNELKEAAEALDASALNTIGSADLLYSGDVDKWKKFAYSEMVRISMRLSKVDAAKAETWVKIAVAGGVFEDITDNALVKHENTATNTTVNGNAWVLDQVDPDATRVSETFVDFLVDNDDPRLTYIATIVADPTVLSDKGDTDPAIQLGQPNGYDLGGATTDISTAPGYPGSRSKYSIVNRNTYARKDAPIFFLTYSETQLLLAEAATRGWVSDESAASHYKKGVVGAMTQLTQLGASPGISEADAGTYVDNNPLDAGNALEQINTQYWVATFMDECESWANWRRSGFPSLTPVVYVGNVTGGTIPRRFTYPTNEAAVNGTNYTEAAGRLSGGDKMTSKVWWDK